MLKEHYEALIQLKSVNWNIELRKTKSQIPINIKKRYKWLSEDIEKFVTEIEMVSNADNKMWLLGIADFDGKSLSEFAWNEWEQQSLVAAIDDKIWTAEIKQFWDQHFPIAISVKSGYAYFAIRGSDLCIVNGEEPEFEETVFIANSLSEFLIMLKEPENKLVRWV